MQARPLRCLGPAGFIFRSNALVFSKKKHIHFCAPVVLRAVSLCIHTLAPLRPGDLLPKHPCTPAPQRPPPHTACSRAPSPLGHPSPLGVHVPVCPCAPAPFCHCTPVPHAPFTLHPCALVGPYLFGLGRLHHYTPAPLRPLHSPRLVGVACHGQFKRE